VTVVRFLRIATWHNRRDADSDPAKRANFLDPLNNDPYHGYLGILRIIREAEVHLSICNKRASQDSAPFHTRQSFSRFGGPAGQLVRRFAMAAWLIAACCPSVARATEVITVGRLRVELERVINRSLFISQSFPLYLDTAGDDSGRLYLPHQGGQVRSVLNNTWSMYLDLSSEVFFSGPRGLLGTAFHPGYANPLSPGYRKFYTFHSVPIPGTPVTVDFPSAIATPTHHNLVTEWKVCDTTENPSCTPGTIDVSTRREVFRQAHGDDEHSGGMLEFGPDGYLHGVIGTPRLGTSVLLEAQDLSAIHGKYFRIDPLDPASTPSSLDPISANGKYRIPEDNPFVDTPGALDEIFATGARNPYRFSIDPVSNTMFAGDVGNFSLEEVSAVPPGGNMGWPYREGTHPGPVSGGTGPFVEPLSDYGHGDGRSVIGGYVYRGSIPLLQGKYIFGEFSWGSGNYNDSVGRLLWMDPFDELGDLKDSPLAIEELVRGESCSESFFSDVCTLDITLYSFGTDDDGELYAVGFKKFPSPSAMVVYKFTDAYFLPEGDYDEDRTVDEADYLDWRSVYGSLPGGTQVRRGLAADGNRNGMTDAADYVLWRKMLGNTTLGSSAVVPEPSTIATALVLATVGIATRRTRRKRVPA
jgi:hypothetical protein